MRSHYIKILFAFLFIILGNICFANQSISFSGSSSQSVIVTDDIQNVNCNGGNDGSIELTMSGSSPPFVFMWNEGSTIQNLNNQVTTQHTWNFPSGWSMFCAPLLPNSLDFDSIFAPIINQVKVIKDDKGHVFWPAYNVNFIGDIDFREGYQIKVQSAQSLTVYGTTIYPELTSINIPQGWSMFGYYRTSPASISILMAPYVNYFEIIKNGLGQIYWVQYQIGIMDMIPGEGYQIYANFPFSITWPPN